MIRVRCMEKSYTFETWFIYWCFGLYDLIRLEITSLLLSNLDISLHYSQSESLLLVWFTPLNGITSRAEFNV